jgi:hypothetical protein
MIQKQALAIALTLALILSMSPLARAKEEPSCVSALALVQLDKSKNLSQFVRSNVEHFWKYFEYKLADSDHLKNLSLIRGTLPRDLNAANFGFVEKERGWGYEFVDYDDVGPNSPLIGVFINHMVNTLARSSEKLGKSEITELSESHLQALINGLEGRYVRPPRTIEKILELRPKEVRKLAVEYVVNKTDRTHAYFKVDGKELLPLHLTPNERKKLKQIIAQNLFVPEDAILDFAQRPKNRGGSKDQKRIWVLVSLSESSEGNRIFELKEEGPNVTAFLDAGPFDEQAMTFRERVREFHRDFNGIFQNEYFNGQPPLVVNYEKHNYLLKQKEPTLLDISQLNDYELMEFSHYNLYLIGRALRFQGISWRTVKNVKGDFLKESIEQINTYFHLVRKYWQENH